MNSIVEHLRVVTCTALSSLDTLTRILSDEGFLIFHLEGAHISDKATLFACVSEQWPHESGMVAHEKWDALIDMLWGGLAELEGERVALIWKHTEKILEHSLADLLIAVDCFQHLASEVATTEHGFPRPMLLKIFLVGIGENFPVFPMSSQVCDQLQ